MQINRNILIGIAATVIVLLLAAFATWYWYLQGAQQSLNEEAAGRGLGETLGGFPVGSAYNNVTGAISEFFGGSGIGTASGDGGVAPRLWLAGAAPTAGLSWSPQSARRCL